MSKEPKPMTTLSLKIRIDGPEVLGKIDLSKVDSSTKPKLFPKRKLNKYAALRDRLDSGWGWSFNQLVKNYKILFTNGQNNAGTNKG